MENKLSFKKKVTKSLVVLGLSWVGVTSAFATPVDSEILILVDGQTFSTASFDFILDGVAAAFESSSFANEVAGGAIGSVAASVAVVNGNGTTTAVPWTVLSGPQDLQGFANSVRSVPFVPTFGGISYVDAISEGVASIAASAAEGALRQITFIEDGRFFFFSDTGAEVRAARDAAFASNGVDTINAVVFNSAGRETAVQNYYDQNVVGGDPAGDALVVGGSVFGAPSGAVAAAVGDSILTQVTEPTVVSNQATAVPEASTLLLLGLSGMSLLVRRRS